MAHTSLDLIPPRGRGSMQDPEAHIIAAFITWLTGIVTMLVLLIDIFSSLSGLTGGDQNPVTPSQISPTPASTGTSKNPAENDSETIGSPSSNSNETGYGANEQLSSDDADDGPYKRDSSYQQGSGTNQE